MKALQVFLIFFSVFSFSQNKYEYFGAIKLNGDSKSVISYRIVFTENNGVVKGFSVTDLRGNHETKNVLEGTYSKKNKILTFSEKEILYTKSPLSDDVFCFVNFSGKTLLSKDNSKIEGEFKGLYKNNKKCIDGTLEMIGAQKIERTLEKADKFLKRSKRYDAETKEKVKPLAILDSLKVNTLTKNQNLNVFVGSNEITIDVWDGKKEDGDKIDLFQNGKKILDNYTVLNKKKTIKVKLSENNNTFRIEALNEGDLEFNTAMIQLSDGSRTFDLTSKLRKGEKTSITIVKN